MKPCKHLVKVKEKPGFSEKTGFLRGLRHGVTVLEVLFSIGIVAVGLLGVLTIVPVAGNRVTQGNIADNGDRLGRNAIRQFDLRNMRQPNMWTRFNPTNQGYQEYGMAWVDLTQVRTSPNRLTYRWRRDPTTNSGVTPPLPWHARSFCIDPLFVARHVENGQFSEKAANFPYFPNTIFDPTANTDFYEPRMDRVSLRNYPGSLGAMTLAQALQVFMAQDDLVFDLPKDRTLTPQQKYDADNAGNVLKRQFDGKYTWMATLTPRYESYLDDINIIPDTYVLSIVVFYRRDMQMTIDVASPEPDNERLVNVSTFYGQGFGGGDIQLQTRSTNPPRPREDLELKEGQWVMLSAMIESQNYPNPPAYPYEAVTLFRWYRVISVDETQPNGALFTRNVTVQGPDWSDAIGRLARNDSTNDIRDNTQATLLNDVVAVYEKTIRLETSGMWTDL